MESYLVPHCCFSLPLKCHFIYVQVDYIDLNKNAEDGKCGGIVFRKKKTGGADGESQGLWDVHP